MSTNKNTSYKITFNRLTDVLKTLNSQIEHLERNEKIISKTFFRQRMAILMRRRKKIFKGLSGLVEMIHDNIF